ncbi:NAD-dependent deacylase [bacterium]|nr:NAD-dependent deacylase [bacterium]
MDIKLLQDAAEKIRNAARVVAFTGAGVSAESGIPPFRGPNGLWTKYDAHTLDINYFNRHPDEAWKTIKEIFYENFRKAKPNDAHIALAEMESRGYLQSLITQNIDNLHQKAGSLIVVEYHGNSQRLICRSCNGHFPISESLIQNMPPTCPSCGEILKPDFIFFGEPIPIKAHQFALKETMAADVWLVIGTTGEVFPAASLPFEAKYKGKTIIEINIQPSNYTYQITDIFLQGPASQITRELLKEIHKHG